MRYRGLWAMLGACVAGCAPGEGGGTDGWASYTEVFPCDEDTTYTIDAPPQAEEVAVTLCVHKDTCQAEEGVHTITYTDDETGAPLLVFLRCYASWDRYEVEWSGPFNADLQTGYR